MGIKKFKKYPANLQTLILPLTPVKFVIKKLNLPPHVKILIGIDKLEEYHVPVPDSDSDNELEKKVKKEQKEKLDKKMSEENKNEKDDHSHPQTKHPDVAFTLYKNKQIPMSYLCQVILDYIDTYNLRTASGDKFLTDEKLSKIFQCKINTKIAINQIRTWLFGQTAMMSLIPIVFPDN